MLEEFITLTGQLEKIIFMEYLAAYDYKLTFINVNLTCYVCTFQMLPFSR